MSRQLAVVFGVFFGVAVTATADDASDEMKKLEGTWVVDSATMDGKPDKDAKGGQVVFAGNKITLKKADGTEEKFTYKVDPSKKPKTMDFVPDEKKPNSATGAGIYELDGDTLKACIGPPDKRPTEFSDKGQMLMVLKRKK